MTTTIQVPDIPPYTIIQPEDYYYYHREQRNKWYTSLGANNVICNTIKPKDYIYCCHLRDYQPQRQIQNIIDKTYYPYLGLLPQNHVNR